MPRGPRVAVALAAAVLAADQISKAIARAELDGGRVEQLPLGFKLELFSNDGIAFSLFDGGGVAISIISMIAFAGLIAFLVVSAEGHIPWVPIGLLAGGALGNLVDRIRIGAVTDFIDPSRWPAFNIADVAITVGVVLVVLDQLRAGRSDQVQSTPTP